MVPYRKFHGLSASAFGKSVPAKSLLVYDQLKELSDELDCLLEDGGIGVLTGEMGMGKTTALRHYFENLGDRACQLCYQGATAIQLPCSKASSNRWAWLRCACAPGSYDNSANEWTGSIRSSAERRSSFWMRPTSWRMACSRTCDC